MQYAAVHRITGEVLAVNQGGTHDVMRAWFEAWFEPTPVDTVEDSEHRLSVGMSVEVEATTGMVYGN